MGWLKELTSVLAFQHQWVLEMGWFKNLMLTELFSSKFSKLEIRFNPLPPR